MHRWCLILLNMLKICRCNRLLSVGNLQHTLHQLYVRSLSECLQQFSQMRGAALLQGQIRLHYEVHVATLTSLHPRAAYILLSQQQICLHGRVLRTLKL